MTLPARIRPRVERSAPQFAVYERGASEAAAKARVFSAPNAARSVKRDALRRAGRNR